MYIVILNFLAMNQSLVLQLAATASQDNLAN